MENTKFTNLHRMLQHLEDRYDAATDECDKSKLLNHAIDIWKSRAPMEMYMHFMDSSSKRAIDALDLSEKSLRMAEAAFLEANDMTETKEEQKH